MAILRAPVTTLDHIIGDEMAAVTLVEYGDYECPHCGAAHPIVKSLQQHFADDLRFAFRHFPLTEIHPSAGPAAETAEFAGAYELFWVAHDSIYANQDRLGLPLLFALAADLELPQQSLRIALETGVYAPKVKQDFLGGVRSGVNGTPSFFINGRRHDGPYDFASLASAIDTARSSARALP
jgi:protein-disulfide isomerase